MFPPHRSPAASPRRTVAVSGELDMGSTHALWRRVVAALDAGTSELHVDLSDVTFIDAAGVGTLVRMKLTAEGRGVPLDVIATRRVSRVLRLSGLSDDLAPAA